MTTVRVLIADTREVREVEVTEMEMPPQYARAARRGLGAVPMRPKIDIPGYVITQSEFTPPEYDYIAQRV